MGKDEKKFYTFEECKKNIFGRFVSQQEFKECKIDSVPRAPDDFYKDKWVNWADFLGYEYKTSSGEKSIDYDYFT